MAKKGIGVPPLLLQSLPQRRTWGERAEMSRCGGRGDGIVAAAALSRPMIHLETGKVSLIPTFFALQMKVYMWLSSDVCFLASSGGDADVEYDSILEECLAAIWPTNKAPQIAAATITMPNSGEDL